jgi:hypothetical protein
MNISLPVYERFNGDLGVLRANEEFDNVVSELYFGKPS